MTGRLTRITCYSVGFLLMSCAALLPDYNSKKSIDKTNKDLRVEIIVSPWGAQICDTGIESPPKSSHYAKMNVTVNQHNMEPLNIFISDNGIGTRFLAAESVSVSYKAGVGEHVLSVGLYTVKEDGSFDIIWQQSKDYKVLCCHEKKALPISRKLKAGD